MRTIRILVRTLSISAVALLGASVAEADASAVRFTQGDAHAVLETYPQTEAVIDRLGEGLDIRPFQQPYGDVDYCAEDWHVLALAYWVPSYAGPPPPEPNPFVFGTRQQGADFLNASEAEFTFDGAHVDATRSPLKLIEQDVIDGEHVQVWGLQWGRILAPDELSIGQHTLRVRATHVSGYVLFDDDVEFTVFGPDSEACT